MPCPGMTFTASADIDVALRISFGGVAAALPAGVFDAGAVTSFGIGSPLFSLRVRACFPTCFSLLVSDLPVRVLCAQLCLMLTLELGKDDTCAPEHRAEIPRIAYMEPDPVSFERVRKLSSALGSMRQ